MKRWIPFLLFFFLSACGIAQQIPSARDSAWATAVKATAFKNLYKLNDSIYRSEQPKKQYAADLKKMGIRSVLDLRVDHSDSLVLKEPGFIYFNVEFVTKHFTDAEIIKALSIIRSAPKPLLVHCKRGSDRTGAVIAMYRIIFENWTKEKALDEMISGDYGFHKRFKNIPAYIKKVDADSLKQILLK